MQEQIFNAKEKKVSRMSRDGLMEENLATKERRKLTDRESEVSFKKSDAEQSFVSGNDASGKKQKKQENRSPPKEEEGKSQEDGNTEHSNYHQGGRSSGYSHESAMAVRERKAKHRSRYHNQRQVKPGKLQFDKMETDGSLNKKNGNQQVNADAEPGTGSHRLQQAEEKAKKSAEKLQHAKKHQTRKKSIQMQRVKDEETQTVKHKLYFNESPKSGKNHAAVKKTGVRLSDAAGGLAHGKIHQEEPDNSAVEAAHKSELAGEIVLRQHSNRSYRKQRKEQRNLNRLERKVYKNTTSYQYKKYLEEHPEMQRKLLQKAFQKQRIKREYQKAYRAGKLAKESKDTAIKSVNVATKVARKLQEIFARNTTVILAVGLLMALLLFIMAGLSSCSAMFANVSSNVIAASCRNGQALVMYVSREEKAVNPPKLYDLTTLQREANRLFGFTAQQTLDYTQSLYEKKLVTYPRTDSQFLTEDMGQTAGNIAGVIKKNISFMQGISHEPKVEKVLNSKKVSDHHAIIPTMELAKADLDKIPGGEMQILSLIAQRLICATGEKHIYETVKAELSCNGIMFTATGKSILQNGWKTYEEQFKKSLKSGNSKAEKEETPLPQLSEGMTFEQVETKVSEHFTAPPKHFTEDTLLSAMEHTGSEQMNDEVERKGLGTPATRAAIIEKLVEKGFVERKNKQMFPTDDGIKLITVLPEVVKSPKLTAEWENDLTLIAKGEKSADTFLAGIEELVSDLVHTYHEVEENGKHMFGSDREVIGKCPKCGGNVYESKSNFYCENRACDFALFKNNKYFASMRKELNKSIAQALLNKGEAKVSGLYSQKKDSTFSAVIHMDASGKYPQFSMTFDNKKQKSNQK